ncbi:MAG: 4a-hydroxytetrahydrobiopterin dehydratase [Nitrososphaerales archaeon]
MSNEKDYRRLSKSEIREGIRELRRWKVVKGKLHRELRFKSFEDAITFMTRSSLDVSKLDHHPEWFNVYNEVKVDLVTHDLGGISGYDLILAKKLEKVAQIFRAN